MKEEIQREIHSLNDINPNIKNEDNSPTIVIDEEDKVPEIKTETVEIKPNVVGVDPSLLQNPAPNKDKAQAVNTIVNPLPDSYNYSKDNTEKKSRGMNIDMEDFDDVIEQKMTEDEEEEVTIDALEKERILEETGGMDISVREISVNVKDSEINTDMDDEKNDEEEFKNLQKNIRQAMPLFNKLNLSELKMSQKPINYTNVLSEKARVSDWILNSDKRVISMKEWKGYELNDILIDDHSRSTFNRYNDIMENIFNHIVSPKPATSEQWVRCTKFAVLDDIYMAIYVSMFAGSNHIAYRCPFCGKQHIVKDIPIEKMVRYKDDIVKQEVQDILRSAATGIPNDEVKLKQVSDNLVFGLKLPSIYDISIEPALLKQEFREKYSEILENISFIENIYTVVNGELRPIMLNKYPGFPEKELKEKIMIFATTIKTLTNDQYMYFLACIAKLDKTRGNLTYILPGSTCPKCGKTSKDDETTAQQLLFTRHQLVPLANM